MITMWYHRTVTDAAPSTAPLRVQFAATDKIKIRGREKNEGLTALIECTYLVISLACMAFVMRPDLDLLLFNCARLSAEITKAKNACENHSVQNRIINNLKTYSVNIKVKSCKRIYPFQPNLLAKTILNSLDNDRNQNPYD